MMNENRSRFWIVFGSFFAIAALSAYFLVSTVRNVTRPVVELSGEIGTQIADVLHPTPTILPDPVTIIREVRTLSRLETIQYTVEKVIRAETGQGALGALFGDRLLFVAHGEVIAGIDLAKLGPEDVWFDDLGRIFIRLPEAEVFVTRLDNEKSYVYDRDTGLLTRGDVNLETEARKVAEDEIGAGALEDGILEQARTNGENYLYRFLRSLDFSDVIFVSQEP
jgi:hypothetical protein